MKGYKMNEKTNKTCENCSEAGESTALSECETCGRLLCADCMEEHELACAEDEGEHLFCPYCQKQLTTNDDFDTCNHVAFVLVQNEFQYVVDEVNNWITRLTKNLQDPSADLEERLKSCPFISKTLEPSGAAISGLSVVWGFNKTGFKDKESQK